MLVGIDTQLYEAAEIDGASRWQRMRFISVPLLTPTIILITLLAIGRIFYGNFGMLYAIVGNNALLYPDHRCDRYLYHPRAGDDD